MKRLLTTTALAIAVGSPALAFDPAAMSQAEREAFGSEIRAYLLENPEVIFEAVAVLEQRQAEAQEAGDGALIAANADALFDDTHSYVDGNPEGDITVVEFFDYRCGYCRKAFDDVNALLEQDGNIRLILKEFPILGEQSTLSSRFAIATKQVAGDEAYKSVHDALMTFKGDLSDTALRRLAEGLGIDADPVLAHMNSDEVDVVIAANHAVGQAMQVSGTPSFVFGDQVLRGYVPLDGMLQIAAEIRAQDG